MQIDLDNRALEGFNEPAKAELNKAAKEFLTDLITESNRIEATRNPASGNPQVTSSMVADAAVLIRRGLARPKKKIGAKVLAVVAAVMSLVVGFLYEPTKLQDQTYMLMFVAVVAISIITITVSIIME